jgi:hypothetical protein
MRYRLDRNRLSRSTVRQADKITCIRVEIAMGEGSSDI